MGAGGAFYVQVFQYIDPGIAYGPATSVEALVAAIVGGMGTLWGPVLGALVLHLLADVTRNLFGQLPGINMVIYGVGAGADRDVPAARHRRHRPAGAPAARRVRRDAPWLSRCCRCNGVSRAFGGLQAVQRREPASAARAA